MKAIILSSEQNLLISEVEQPAKAAAGHIIVKIAYATINPGDKFFLKTPSLPGAPKSLYEIRGVSGAGAVVAIGEGVPAEYRGSHVTIYRQLKYSEEIVGTWSGYAHVPFQTAAILPADAKDEEYSGSMVNIITPFGFMNEVLEAGHKGILATAGNSATGIAMLGFCLAYNIPLLSIVRDEAGKKELEALGAKHVIAQDSPNFKQELKEQAAALNTTAVFEGVGGAILNQIIPVLPLNSVVYSYGYLGGPVALSIQMTDLMPANVSIRPFSNFRAATVRDVTRLEAALKDISRLLAMPHFKTKVGKIFQPEEIDAALAFTSKDGGKAVLDF